jgi:hypothetical protein
VPTLSGEFDYSSSPVRTSGDEVTSDPNSTLPPLDALEAFADLIVAAVEEFLKELVYDRSRLTEWFSATYSSGGLDAFFGGVRMLEPVPRVAKIGIFVCGQYWRQFSNYPVDLCFAGGERLIPTSPYDLVAFNLLTQVTEDELRMITLYVPPEKLMTLSSDLVEVPGKPESGNASLKRSPSRSSSPAIWRKNLFDSHTARRSDTGLDARRNRCFVQSGEASRAEH